MKNESLKPATVKHTGSLRQRPTKVLLRNRKSCSVAGFEGAGGVEKCGVAILITN